MVDLKHLIGKESVIDERIERARYIVDCNNSNSVLTIAALRKTNDPILNASANLIEAQSMLINWLLHVLVDIDSKNKDVE